ncbi:MAG: DUF1571 domain-containing protein [bacterium]|nr:DUF1571 domain-containing protein [bacterium]
MFKETRWNPNRRRRALLGLLITASLGVQCQQMTRRNAPTTAPISVERLYTAALVTDATDELEVLAKSDPMAFLDRCRENYFANYRDYICTFTKQERIGKRVTAEQETVVKYRERPCSVNMRWVRNADAAAHVTYIEGRWPDKNGLDQAWCEPAGAIARLFVKKILQPIHGRSASKASRRSIDQFGFRSTLELIVKYSRRADDAGVLDLRYVGPGSVDGRSTFVFERRSPYTGQEEPYPDRLLVFHIDREWLVPTACYSYRDDLGDDLLGRYVLTDVTFNNDLDDQDFGPESLGL